MFCLGLQIKQSDQVLKGVKYSAASLTGINPVFIGAHWMDRSPGNFWLHPTLQPRESIATDKC